jgi:hypothetical protein
MKKTKTPAMSTQMLSRMFCTSAGSRSASCADAGSVLTNPNTRIVLRAANPLIHQRRRRLVDTSIVVLLASG